MKIVFCPEFFSDLKRVFRSKWHPMEIWYRFTCWIWRRYSTVKPRYLPHTWCDRSEILPHAMFEILSAFIEKECSPGHIDWYHEHASKVMVDGKERFVRDELQDIYDWWHEKYNKEFPAAIEALYDSIPYESGWKIPSNQRTTYAKINRIGDRISKELAQYMHRLINITDSLWT